MKLWFLEIVLILSVFFLLLKTSEVLPLTWDEGDSFARVDSILKWSTLSFQTKFSEESILQHWPHTICREGHPAGYSIVIALGKSLADHFRRISCLQPVLSEKVSYRFGPLLLFSFALGAVFYRIQKIFDKQTGFFCVLSILCIPRLFAICQIATCDSVLISSWLLAWAFFPFDRFLIRKDIFCGFWLGLTFSAKFSGWIAVIPFAIYILGRSVKKFASGESFSNEKTCIQKENCPEIHRISQKKQEPFYLWGKNFSFHYLPISLWGHFLLICITALGVFILFNPPIWRHPLSGIQTFFQLNITRSDFNIPVYFFGQLYSPSRPLPWFNTIVWTGITVPAGFLILAFWSLCYYLKPFCCIFSPKFRNRVQYNENRLVSEKEQCFFLILLNFVVLIIVRAFPGLPVHDGVRLFIPAFAFLGILIGIGASLVWPKKSCQKIETSSSVSKSLNFMLIRRTMQLKLKKAKPVIQTKFGDVRSWGFLLTRQLLIVTIFIISLSHLYYYSPQWLSFYNLIIGGPQGAQKAGFETTYYWDALDKDVLQWINQNAKSTEFDSSKKVLFGSFSSQTLYYYRKFGLIQPDCQTISSAHQRISGEYSFYVLQRRASGLTLIDLLLMRNAKPVYIKTIGQKRNAFSNLDNLIFRTYRNIRILEIYSFDDFQKAVYLSKRLEQEKTKN
ncbi:MAG: glycosyltransferase family 39 protein [Planctomycetia bacterium]|nr:glycosyltransferase family 39 protein [Planctomycetia bacterium]